MSDYRVSTSKQVYPLFATSITNTHTQNTGKGNKDEDEGKKRNQLFLCHLFLRVDVMSDLKQAPILFFH